MPENEFILFERKLLIWQLLARYLERRLQLLFSLFHVARNNHFKFIFSSFYSFAVEFLVNQFSAEIDNASSHLPLWERPDIITERKEGYELCIHTIHCKLKRLKRNLLLVIDLTMRSNTVSWFGCLIWLEPIIILQWIWDRYTLHCSLDLIRSVLLFQHKNREIDGFSLSLTHTLEGKTTK